MSRTILRNATIIDGTGAAPAPGDVVIDDGSIVDIGVGLDGDHDVDLSGRWLLPGFFDCHTHVMISTINLLQIAQTPFSLNFYAAARNLRNTLRAGVTSVRDAGGADLGVKQAVESGLIHGPRMKIAISILSQTGGHGDTWFASGASLPFFVEHPGRPDGVCDGPDAVLKRAREVIRAGADVLKVCATGGVLSPRDHPTSSQFLREELDTIVRVARAAGLTTMAHAQGTQGIQNAICAGVESIEHGIFLDDVTIEMMLERGTFLVPTLMATQGVLESLEALPAAMIEKARDVRESHRESIRRAATAGVRIAMGTDSGVTAHGRNLEELQQMIDIGMTPMAAIVASTKTAAENLRVADRRGTITLGKDADLVAMTVDPLEDAKPFSDPSKVSHVWLGGRLVEGDNGRA